MIVSLKVTKEQRHALLFRYVSVKSFLQRTLLETADKLIADNQIEDIERELNEYHDRRVLNGYDIHRRKHTQATKDLISASLIKRYEGKKFPMFEETKKKIGLIHKGKITPQEVKDKISKANKNKVRTEEQRQNISLGHTGMKYKKRVKVECVA